ncbi:MAG: hypothetical protein Q4E74_07120 [Ruminococcus sp.]|nr:hypothetical protein [Ruminococcus sp.]
MNLIFQLSEEYRNRVKRRNKVRLKIAAVCFVLVIIGLLIVRIIA